MKPTETWPATAFIILMTSVFGLSVAIWCGETTLSLNTGAAPGHLQAPSSSTLGFAHSSIAVGRPIPNQTYLPTRPSSSITQFQTPQAESNGFSPTLASGISGNTAARVASSATTQSNSGKQAKNAIARKKFPNERPFEFSSANQVFDLLASASQSVSARLVVTPKRLLAQARLIILSAFAEAKHTTIQKPTPIKAMSSGRSAREAIAPNTSKAASPNQKSTSQKATNQITSQSPWTSSKVLLEQLESLGSPSITEALQPEIVRCVQILNQLPTIETISDARLPAIFEELNTSADKLWDGARSIAANPASADSLATAAKLSRMSYEIHRAVSIWSLVQKSVALKQKTQRTATQTFQVAGMPVWNFGNVDKHWRDYLGLELLEDSAVDKCRGAREILGRLYSVALTPQQQARAHEIIDRELENQLRGLAAQPFEPAQLLADLTLFQNRPNGFSSHQLNQHFQNCLWNEQAPVFALAQALDDHYRNANIRLTISERLLNRMLDQPRTQDEPVRDQILGANVSGRSQITNRLGVQMVPDPSGWSLVLTTSGNILSRTQAHRDGFVIHSIGTADVFGSKRVSISYDGVHSDIPQVDAVTDNQVIGLDSPFDDIPILGWTARRVAQRKQQSSAPLADQQVRSRIRSRVQEKMEQAVSDVLQKARDELNRQIVSRFVKLSLEPQPVEMQTTENELVLRYRLAGFDQMAADTPRPTIDDQKAASLQVHESAINNALERLEIAGQSFSFPTLLQHLEVKLGTQFDRLDEKVDRVEVDFAPFDPIRVDFDQANVVLTMNLKRLQIEQDKNWRNVSIKTRYEVQFDGFYLTLQQVGGVRAEGSRVRVRDEIAIGAIFDHVLQDQYRFSVLPETYRSDFERLGVQLADVGLTDGWLSIAYDNKPIAEPAERQAGRLLPRLR